MTLIDLRQDPIEKVTPTGIETSAGAHDLDVLVLATGFDAITGSMLRLDPKGRAGVALQEKWSGRYPNYLGMTISEFPNLFMIHGPGTPGVLYAMPLGAEEGWEREVTDLANKTLFPRTDSWYTGANIPGKPRQLCVHVAGPAYFQRIREVADEGFEGLVFEEDRGRA